MGSLIEEIFFDEQFIWGLGVAPDEAECFDVYGLDEELLEMVPKPILAVLFLYPLTSQVLRVETALVCFLNVLLFFICRSLPKA